MNLLGNLFLEVSCAEDGVEPAKLFDGCAGLVDTVLGIDFRDISSRPSSEVMAGAAGGAEVEGGSSEVEGGENIAGETLLETIGSD